MKNMGNMLKQAQQMQAQMAKFQEELGNLTVTGQAGAGMVSVTMNGKQMVQKVAIDPKAVDVEDMEMLEDLIAAAFNDAQKRIQDVSQERLSRITGGMNIPGMNLPF